MRFPVQTFSTAGYVLLTTVVLREKDSVTLDNRGNENILVKTRGANMYITTFFYLTR